jgi:hypothetical protein
MGFCSERFDHLVDAEELLASQGLVVPGPEIKQQTRNSLWMGRRCCAGREDIKVWTALRRSIHGLIGNNESRPRW